MEIQFYLVYAIFTGFTQKLTSSPKRFLGFESPAVAVTSVALFCLSIGPSFFNSGWHVSIFLIFWHMFFLGAMAWWAIDEKLHSAWFFLALVAELVWGHYAGMELSLAASTAAGLLFFAGKFNKLETWGGGPVLQYLGKISYSLYLGQALFGQKVIKIGARWTGLSPLSAYSWLAAGYVVIIITAILLYQFIERPTVRLSARLKKPTGGTREQSVALDPPAFIAAPSS